MAKWSIKINLVLNTCKTKFMLITTNQMSTQHKLKDKQFQICCNIVTLEIVNKWKLLGVTIDEKNVSLLLKNCYLYLSILKKNAKDVQSVHKQLIESLILSRLDYYKNLFINLP